MHSHVLGDAAGHVSNFGWILGFTIGGVIVLVVVALVVPILMLAYNIGNEAQKINGELQKAVKNTSALAGLRTTIDYAVTIIGGLQRGRARLGG
jgi:ABC-type Fe3+ transport system permease subunit